MKSNSIFYVVERESKSCVTRSLVSFLCRSTFKEHRSAANDSSQMCCNCRKKFLQWIWSPSIVWAM